MSISAWSRPLVLVGGIVAGVAAWGAPAQAYWGYGYYGPRAYYAPPPRYYVPYYQPRVIYVPPPVYAVPPPVYVAPRVSYPRPLVRRHVVHRAVAHPPACNCPANGSTPGPSSRATPKLGDLPGQSPIPAAATPLPWLPKGGAPVSPAAQAPVQAPVPAPVPATTAPSFTPAPGD